ncbi:MAG: diphosphomevalonate decarboxylase [Pelolinea sp.]|nr:diphosphomevalonate decarboxylase [Pelolinea sp.]
MVNKHSITAKAHPNIAFIKYWGNQDNSLRLPSNGSISMNLANLNTVTTAAISQGSDHDSLELNGIQQSGPVLVRVQQYMDQFRNIFIKHEHLDIKSTNDFPISAGIASSASAFAALSTAAANIYDLDLTQNEISALARLGSGSACRSIPTGFTEWKTGNTHEDSYAVSIAPENHWNLWDCIAVIQSSPKDVSSTQGHNLANSSPLQYARIKDAARRLDICRNAILNKDFETLAEIIELDSNMMHAVMMTSKPTILYWQPTSIAIMQEVRQMRKNGIAAAYTLDAGSNVHVICNGNDIQKIEDLLVGIAGVNKIIKSPVGSGASVVSLT